MKEISQEEFEAKIESILRGETTRKKLAKELEMEIRTLNYRILSLSKNNPDLYERFIQKFPYRPKEIKIDATALAIRVINNGIVRTAKQVGISVRSIQRKVNQLAIDNPELYHLYTTRNMTRTPQEKQRYNWELDKVMAASKRDQKVERVEMKEKVDDIRNILAQFEKMVESGMSKNSAACALGFDGYPTIWKKYQDLKRIETERAVSEKSDNKKEKETFKADLKVDIGGTVPTSIQKEQTNSREEIEGR